VKLWAIVLVSVAMLVFIAWLLRYDRWETSQASYVLDRWTGTIHECVDGKCYLAF